MKHIKEMTKDEMIYELVTKYQYPINKKRSRLFISRVLEKARKRHNK